MEECNYNRLDSQASGLGGLGAETKEVAKENGNLVSLNNTCLQVYNLLVSKSRHKYPLETVE